MGIAKMKGPADFNEFRRLVKLTTLFDRYWVGSISWFIPWIVVASSCKVIDMIHDIISFVLTSELLSPKDSSWTKGRTHVKATTTAATIEIMIWAASDEDKGSWSLLGFVSCRFESCGFWISSGWQIFWGALIVDPALRRMLRKVLIYGLTNNGLDEQRTV